MSVYGGWDIGGGLAAQLTTALVNSGHFSVVERAEVAEGDRVERGQIIGRVGASGRATGPHPHLAAHLRQARIDPAGLLGLRLPE